MTFPKCLRRVKKAALHLTGNSNDHVFVIHSIQTQPLSQPMLHNVVAKSRARFFLRPRHSFTASTSALTRGANVPQCITKTTTTWPPAHMLKDTGAGYHVLDKLPVPAYPHLALERPYLMQPICLSPPRGEKSKILYEVTLELDEDIFEAYLTWIRMGHIQEVMALPGFVGWQMSVSEDDAAKTNGAKGQKRVVLVETYEVASRETLEEYFTKYAKRIRDDHKRMWDGKFAASRRILHRFGLQTETEANLWKQRDGKNAFRLKNLQEQLARVPRFTADGLKLQALPTPLWEKLQEYYKAHRHESVEDRLDPAEISINTWVAPTLRLDLPPALATEVVGTLKPILEEWSGISELESTGISGIRTYLPGATIAEHVDMATTNVISALINVDQNVSGLWPFEMKDHAGKLHSLHMKPGEVVIYESATCAHQRSHPLPSGGHYTNLFMRFKPKGWTFSY